MMDVSVVRFIDIMYALSLWCCVYAIVQATLLIRYLHLDKYRAKMRGMYNSAMAVSSFILFISVLYLVVQFKWQVMDYGALIGMDDILWSFIEAGYLFSCGYTISLLREVLERQNYDCDRRDSLR